MANTDNELKGPDLAAGVPFADLRDGESLLGHVEGESAIVVRAGEDVFAIGATCTHYGGPLAEGLVTVTAAAGSGARDAEAACTVRCPWHHACFDARTGAALGGPALNPVASSEVVRDGDLVRVGKKRPEWRGAAPSRAPESVVIVGAGPAGAVCAETLRRHGYEGPVTLIGSELPGPVDRPNLSKDYLAGNAPEEWIPLRGDDFYRETKIDFRPGETVTAIDRGARTITTSKGTLEYGALLLATGAEPVRLPLDGASLPHVHVLRTLDDSRSIIAAITERSAKRAVVIGGSFIGLEVAASLRARDVDVTIVAPESVPLARVLGEQVGKLVLQIHKEKGEKFELGRKPAKITERAVVLDDGRELAADLVVMGVGVRPRTKLAEAAGLRVDNGIVVREDFRTEDPNVYAAGDVARYPYRGELVRIEHFAVAERQGRAAALAMLGNKPPIVDVPFFWSQHHDVTLSYVGHAERWDRVEIRGSLDARDALVAYLERDRVRAVVTINRDEASLLAERAMQTDDDKALSALLAG